MHVPFPTGRLILPGKAKQLLLWNGINEAVLLALNTAVCVLHDNSNVRKTQDVLEQLYNRKIPVLLFEDEIQTLGQLQETFTAICAALPGKSNSPRMYEHTCTQFQYALKTAADYKGAEKIQQHFKNSWF